MDMASVNAMVAQVELALYWGMIGGFGALTVMGMCWRR